MKVTDRRKGLEGLDVEDRVRFEQLVLPHLDAGFNLAAWLLSSRSDAEDVTKEAILRAYRFFPGFSEEMSGRGCCRLSATLRNT